MPRSIASEAENIQDHNVFLNTFAKYTQTAIALSARHAENPLFLKRNLEYVKRFSKASQGNRKPFSLSERYSKEDLALQIYSDSWLELSIEGVEVAALLDPTTQKDRASLDSKQKFDIEMCLSKGSDSSEVLQHVTVTGDGRDHLGKKCQKIRVPGSKLLSPIPSHQLQQLIFKVQPRLTQNTTKKLDRKVMKGKKRLKNLSFQRMSNGLRRGEDSDSSTSCSSSSSVASSSRKRTLHNISNSLPPKRAKLVNGPSEVVCMEGQFIAHLALFDSRLECLLKSGSYKLGLVSQCSSQETSHSRLPSLGWQSIFGFDNEMPPMTLPQPKFQLSVTAKWNGEVPDKREVQKRTARLSQTLRSSYDAVLPNLRKRDEGSSMVSNRTEEEELVIYNFVYSNDSVQQTECERSLSCPWCHDNFLAVHSLLYHLSLCHPYFSFSCSPIQHGYSIDVRVNEDGGEAISGLDAYFPVGQGLSRDVLTELIVWKGNKSAAIHNVEVFLPNDNTSVHSYRQFYHIHTCLPILTAEQDEDSEDEEYPVWLRQKMRQMIDEFSDVTEKEKNIMKLWNEHVMDLNVIAIAELSEACLSFAIKHKDHLTFKGLDTWYLIALARFQELGLVAANTITRVGEIMRS